MKIVKIVVITLLSTISLAIIPMDVKQVKEPQQHKKITLLGQWSPEAIKIGSNTISNTSQAIIGWVDKHPEDINAVFDDGSTLLIFAIDFLVTSLDAIKLIESLLHRNVNSLARDETQRNALEHLLLLQSNNADYLASVKERLIPQIVDRMIQQGADPLILLHDTQKTIQELNAGKNSLTTEQKRKTEAARAQRKSRGIAGSIIEKDLKKLDNKIKLYQLIVDTVLPIVELEAARAALCTLGVYEEGRSVLPRELGTILAPSTSNRSIQLIKDAIDANNEEKLAQALGPNNENIELPDQNGYTPLLYAAHFGKEKMMRYLIAQGANTAQYSGPYQKLVDEERVKREENVAKEKKEAEEQEKRVQIQIAKNAESLLLSIQANRIDEVQNWATPATINYRGANNSTPLMVAANLGRNEIVDYLLDNGADASLKDINHDTALHFAIYYDHYPMALKIIRTMQTADLLATNKSGFTVRDIALKKQEQFKDNEDYKNFLKALQEKLSEK